MEQANENPVQESSPASPIPPSIPPPKRRNPRKIVLVIAAVISIIVTGIVGYFLVVSRQEQIESQDMPRNSTSTTSVLPTSAAAKRSDVLHLYSFGEGQITQLVEFEVLTGGGFGAVRPLQRGSAIYFADVNTVYRYDLNSKEKTIIYKEKSKKPIMSIQVSNDNKLYVSLLPEESKDNYSEDVLEVVEVEIGNGKVLRTLTDLQPVFYGGIHYLFKTGDIDIVMSQGGDGCGGWGTISTYKDAKMNPMIEFGAGCAEEPRYLGFDEQKNQIIMASILPFPEDGNYLNEKYDVLYALNVLTKEQSQLLDLKTIPEIKGLKLSNDKEKVAIITSSSIVMYNTNTKSTKTIDLTSYIQPDIEVYYSWATDDKQLVGIDGNFNPKIKIDVLSGEVQVYDMPIHDSKNSEKYFLGTRNQDVILYKYSNN